MNELDFFIYAAIGGSLTGCAIGIIMLAQIKHEYDEKILALQMQVIALRAELNAGYSDD